MVWLQCGQRAGCRRAGHQCLRCDQYGGRYGGSYLDDRQLVAVGAVWGWSILGTFVILKVVNLFVPLRVHEDEEVLGLDLSQHGEPAYASIHAN